MGVLGGFNGFKGHSMCSIGSLADYIGIKKVSGACQGYSSGP